MLQLSASEKLTGQCPNCGWCPPPQNAFRPNIMNQYRNEKGVVAVLTESNDIVETPSGKWYRVLDDNGGVINRTSSPKAPIQTGGSAVNQQQIQQPVVQQNMAAQQVVVPSKEIPTSMLKTPEEVANTPKPTLAPIVLPTPVASNPAAPAQTPEPKQP